MWPTIFIAAPTAAGGASGGTAGELVRSSSYPVTAGGERQALPFESVAAQSGVIWDGSRPTEIVLSDAGLYCVAGSVSWAADSTFTGPLHAEIALNSGGIPIRMTQSARTTSIDAQFTFAGFFYAGAGEAIELLVATNKGSGTQDVTSARIGVALMPSTSADYVGLSRSSSLEISATTVVGMDTVDYGASGLWAGGTSANIVVPSDKTGWWLFGFGAQVSGASTDTGNRGYIRRAGVDSQHIVKSPHAGPSVALGISGAGVVNESSTAGIDYQFVYEENATTNPTLAAGEGRFVGAWIPAASATHAVSYSHTANQTVTANTDTVMNWPTTLGTAGSLDATADRVTIPVGGAGWYFISAWGGNNAGNTASTQMWLRKNGSAVVGSQKLAANGSSIGNTNTAHALVYLAEGDYVEVMIRASAAITWTSAGGGNFSAVRLMG